jgi:hypothetical protein
VFVVTNAMAMAVIERTREIGTLRALGTLPSQLLRTLALEGMVWSRRSLVVGLMVALPAVLALVYRIAARGGSNSEVSPFELYGIAVAFYWVRNALPLVALFFATALIADEVEGKTITYLLTRPIGRSAILAGKFLAYLATTLSLALPAAVVTFFLLATARGRDLLRGHRPLHRPLHHDAGAARLRGALHAARDPAAAAHHPRPALPVHLGADREPARLSAALHDHGLAALADPAPAGRRGPGRRTRRGHRDCR